VPKPSTFSPKSLSSKEWRKELLLSWLFRTCFKLQSSLDRRFLNFGMTFQEAVVLMRCVEAREIAPGRLALILARDKGKITRFIDRLEAAELVTRQASTTDRRYSAVKATPKGKRVAERIASTFDEIRKELFVGVLDRDIQRLSRTLPQLLQNAVQIGAKRPVPGGRQTRRIGHKRNRLQEIESLRLKETTLGSVGLPDLHFQV
jgi:DNA-binding MarR family transcriptional regulator